MKILHVETGRHLYGGALQVLYLLRGLADRPGIRNVLVCPRGSAISGAARDHVDALHAVPAKGDLDILLIPRLMKIIRKERPDIVHLHSRRGADVLGGIAARLSRKECILTRRVDNPENPLWAGIKYRLYHRVITISEGIGEVLLREGVPPEKITCVHSAIDPDAYSHACDRDRFEQEFGLPQGARTCGVIAQLIPRKGHRFLLEAAPRILETVPDVVFLFFGKGPLEKWLRSRCRELGIEHAVRFAGFRDDLPDLLGCLDLVAHPALMEGLGVSLLQAAAAGVPIVGTGVGGIPEIVQDGVNGYLVPPSDAGSLAEALVKVLTDRDLARRLGGAGRQIARERFSIEAMVSGNLTVYEKLTHLQPGPGF